MTEIDNQGRGRGMFQPPCVYWDRASDRKEPAGVAVPADLSPLSARALDLIEERLVGYDGLRTVRCDRATRKRLDLAGVSTGWLTSPRRSHIDYVIATAHDDANAGCPARPTASPQQTPPQQPRERSARFSTRDLEVGEYLMRGWTNAQIAAALGISAGTVARQIRRMRLRTRTATRGDLAAYLKERSTVESGPTSTRP